MHYNKPEYRALVERLVSVYPNVRRLDEYANVNCGPFGSEITSADYVEHGIPLLRISNITKEGEIDSSDLVYISPEKANTLLSTQVQPGDIVVSQRGTLGMPAVIPSDIPVANISANLIAVRNLSGLSAEFVQIYLSSNVGGKQIERTQSGQVQGKITTEDIASVLVPQTPERQQLVANMRASRDVRAEKLRQADDALAGVDTFLLATLGLTPSPSDTRTTYAVRLGELRASGHANASYFHPQRINAIRTAAIHADKGLLSMPLSEIVHFVRDQTTADAAPNYLGLAHVQSNTGELTHSDDTAEGACFFFERGDVLFARLRPYLNKVYCAEQGGVCSTEFHVMRIRPQGDSGVTVLPEYLAAILRSSLTLAQTRHMMTGNTHPRLANEDVANLVVPVPKDVTTQQRIVEEVGRRRDVARRLRAEAAESWAAAKAEFERALLGEEVGPGPEGPG